jgi:hypothetical protein
MSIVIWLIITVVIFLIGLTVVIACIKSQKGKAAIIFGLIFGVIVALGIYAIANIPKYFSL